MHKILITGILLGFTILPAQAFPWRKIVTAPVHYVKDVAYEIGVGLMLRRIL